MLTKEVQREYAKLRKAHITPFYESCGRADSCLRLAKEAVWVSHNWQDFDGNGVALSNDGNWRLRIVPDESCQSEGDLFGDTYNVEAHGNTVPGGKRTIEAQHKEALARIERDGVWGYILEKKCSKCGNWEHVDSCYGFEYEVPSYEIVSAQFQAKS